MPRKPISPKRRKSSRGNSPFSSHARRVRGELLLREVADQATEGLVLLGEGLEGDGGRVHRPESSAPPLPRPGRRHGGGTAAARCPSRVAQATPATETAMPTIPTAVIDSPSTSAARRTCAMGVSCSQAAASPTESAP